MYYLQFYICYVGRELRSTIYQETIALEKIESIDYQYIKNMLQTNIESFKIAYPLAAFRNQFYQMGLNLSIDVGSNTKELLSIVFPFEIEHSVLRFKEIVETYLKQAFVKDKSIEI